jgi:1,4-alpha-glucan branching enzyme
MQDFNYIFEKRHHNPHLVLGLNDNIIRAFHPSKEKISIKFLDKKITLKKIDERGFFEYESSKNISRFDYKLNLFSDEYIFDPYSFNPITTIDEIDKFKNSTHDEAYKLFGSHEIVHENVKGIKFCVYAPNSVGVCLLSSFNDWDRKSLPLRNIENSGVWEIFIPNLNLGHKYKYEITIKNNKVITKTDPYSNYYELRPNNSSIISKNNFKFTDSLWMEKREKNLSKPINIYEVHLEAFKEDKYFLNYKKIAHKVLDHIKMLGYNYIEIMPLMEHPLDDSWGYQAIGYFSITSRYGKIDDFKYFVNLMHLNNIAVILDWVPAHFCSDEFALSEFDGSCLYEIDDKDKNIHKLWKSKIFDYKKNIVKNFLISSAIYYLDTFHIDGLRIDALSSMIYEDNAIKEGKWQINKKDNNYNLYAIEFIKKLNQKINKKYPDVLLIAEEATSYEGICDNLNFDLKWNMGFTFDVFSFFETSFEKRKDIYNKLTFQLTYAFKEKHLLCLSHDEVVNKSIYSKMYGSEFEKFENLKTLYVFMMTFPGKKLFFMGCELMDKNPWVFNKKITFDLLKNKKNQKFFDFIKDLNHLYLNTKELYFYDFSLDGFKWVECEDSDNLVLAYLRHSDTKKILVVHNFSSNDLKNYELKLNAKKINHIFNTSDVKYSFDDDFSKIIKYNSDNILINIKKFTSLIYEVID